MIAAGRTNTDAIRDLERNTALLMERLNSVSKEIVQVRATLEQTNEAVTQLRIESAILKERHNALRQSVERMQQREAKIALLVLGSFLTFLANIAVLILQRLR